LIVRQNRWVAPSAALALAGTLIATLVGGLLSGCTEPPPPPPGCGAVAPFALAIGGRANSPALKLPPEVSALMTESARARHRVVLVRVDGEPAVVHDEPFRTTAGNPQKERVDFDEYLGRLKAAMREKTRAAKGEADPFGALTIAARATEPGDTVVLADSGLQTVAPLRFQDDGGILLESEPAELVAYLTDELEVLPDLSGRALLFVGLGNTAPPQPQINTRQRRNLIAIWTAIAEAAGAACVRVFDDAGTAEVVPDVPAVTVVPVATGPPPPPPCGETVLADNNGVGFVADQATFKDPAAADRTITAIADAMRRGRQHAELVGTTANVGPYPGQVDLSLKRAEAVKRVLVGAGIAESRITTRGVGSRWPGYVPDRGPNSTLLPGPAAANRKVIVHLSCG